MKNRLYLASSIVVILLLVIFGKDVSAASSESQGKFKHKPITVTVTGDILLDKSVGERIKKYGVDYPFKSVGPLLKKSDLTAGNLETSVTVRGKAQPKQFTFRSKPATLKGVYNAGFDMVSLANNHTLDYGQVGLTDTMTNLKKYKIGYSGAGKNDKEAFKAYQKVINGKKVAILGISRVLPETSWMAGTSKPGLASGYSTEPMMKYVKKAVKSSDYTIVMIHWNKESTDYPEPYARDMAKKFIDAGVDAVVGSHSHTLMGIDYYKNAPIFYSMGNFVFTSSSAKSSETMMATLTFNQNKVGIKIIPAKIVNGQPMLMNDDFNQKVIKKLNTLSPRAKISKSGKVSKR